MPTTPAIRHASVQTERHDDARSSTVDLHVSSGFSEPVTVALPRSALDLPFREVVRDAIRRQLPGVPAADCVGAMLSQPGLVVESDGRYLDADARAREVLEATGQDQQQSPTVRRLLAQQSGGARVSL